MVVNVIAWKLEVRSERTYKKMPKEKSLPQLKLRTLTAVLRATEISLSTFKGGLHVTFV